MESFFYIARIIVAEGEGEAGCVELQKKGIADYVYSEDMDVLTFGCTKFLRCSNKKDYYTEISLNHILSNLEMNCKNSFDIGFVEIDLFRLQISTPLGFKS